jgi:hypothetical protein
MATALRRATAALLLPLALASPGCLSSSYRVTSDELARIARVAPEQRWQTVRVTQGLLDSDHPPVNAGALRVGPPLVVVPDVFWFHGRSRVVPRSWRSNPGASSGAVRPGVGGGGRSSGGGGGSSGGGGGGGGGAEVVAIVAIVVVAAAGIVFVLAGTEGARYDGWMAVPPDETVYLDNADGSVTAVPLSALTPELVDQALGATIYEGRSERYLRLARAPLDRVGFTVQAGAVGAMLPRVGRGGHGFGAGGRAFFGGYPMRQAGLGATADIVAGADGTLLASVGAEVQVMPLLWAGAYAGAGWSWLYPGEPVPRARGWYARAGAQLELPLTTRLAASLRAGVTRLDLDAGAGTLWMPELSLGLSLY